MISNSKRKAFYSSSSIPCFCIHCRTTEYLFGWKPQLAHACTFGGTTGYIYCTQPCVCWKSKWGIFKEGDLINTIYIKVFFRQQNFKLSILLAYFPYLLCMAIAFLFFNCFLVIICFSMCLHNICFTAWGNKVKGNKQVSSWS